MYSVYICAFTLAAIIALISLFFYFSFALSLLLPFDTILSTAMSLTRAFDVHCSHFTSSHIEHILISVIDILLFYFFLLYLFVFVVSFVTAVSVSCNWQCKRSFMNFKLKSFASGKMLHFFHIVFCFVR